MSEPEVRAAATAWDQAMIGNDAEAIGAFMGEEWVIVGQDGSVTGKADFLALIASGDVTHDVMTSDEMDVRVYGDAAVVIARSSSGGAWKGEPFLMHERGSNVFVRREGRWVCVLTHLSTVAD